MKTRNGFVSNSSSASFVVNRYYVSDYMIDKIKAHTEEAGSDAWSVYVEEGDIYLSTNMDNFDMMAYLWKIGVPREAIKDDY